MSDGWEIHQHIRQRIVWRQANIMNRDEIEEMARSRVIFSRNIFIYFTEAAIRKVIGVFEQCMPDPGYLFLGAAESLLKFSTKFSLEEIGEAFVYVKGRNS